MSDDRVFAKCAWRLIPFMMLLYIVSFIDRVNVGFAALTMNRDLGFSPAVYGFGAGIFFFSYALCQLPASLFLARLGPRMGVCCILGAWGAISAANAFVWNPASFYVVRFFLGIAEAGFFPLMLLYLTYWFPKAYLARNIAAFQASNPMAVIIGGPLSGFVLGMEGVAGFHGWQWLFLIEGLPAGLLALAVFKFLPDGPAAASWLDSEEKAMISARLAGEGKAAQRNIWPALRDPRVFAIGLAGAGLLFTLNGTVLWLPQIVQAMGYSNRAGGFVVAVPFVFTMGAMVLWGRSSDRRGERVWHIALAALLSAAGLGVASLSTSDWVVLSALTVAVVGLFCALPTLNSLAPSFLSGSAAAAGIALYNTIAQLGGFLGPVSVGVLRQQTGDYAAGLAALSFSIAATAVVVLALGRAMAPRPVRLAPES